VILESLKGIFLIHEEPAFKEQVAEGWRSDLEVWLTRLSQKSIAA
jgi:hypothetical protein